ncbi:Uncharacterized protein SCP_0304560 [Sparassis crispa]|uniref:Amidohydrolase-related domain-containing protein n=1 Tax=Sparassis crispa TaxID=139825 RepID=A0A401GEY2_9APHY|nr:Uncharacterized protein SCP_0304560 [Sparassis crispa]GBE80737.1 Uncharacterized protein SCP_0304560 [Sparassis crispa]
MHVKGHKLEVYPGSPEKTRDSLLPKLAVKPWIKPYPPDLILRNAQVVDPERSSLVQGLQDVHIREGHIVSIISSQLYNAISGNDHEQFPSIVDLGGKYLCPGLIDCHVHVTAVPGVKTVTEMARLPEEAINLRSTYALREMLLRGFTTVRDTGGASKVLADAVSEGLILGPRLIQCGKALSQTGGHSDFGPATRNTGCCGGHVQSLGRTCDGVPEVLKATREELKAGADFIKVMCGGGVASPTDAIETIQFTAEEIQAITTTCRHMGSRHTTAHAYTDASVLHAIKNGVKGIEHGNLISSETAKLQVLFPGLLAMINVKYRMAEKDFLPPDSKAKNEQVMEHGLEALKIADEAGVTVCYGSDLLTSLQALQTEEFTVRSSVLSSPKILKHATTNAALMLDDVKIGRVAPGAYADMIILDANPLDDITVLDYPEYHLFAVIKDGRVVTSRINELQADVLY